MKLCRILDFITLISIRVEPLSTNARIDFDKYSISKLPREYYYSVADPDCRITPSRSNLFGFIKGISTSDCCLSVLHVFSKKHRTVDYFLHGYQVNVQYNTTLLCENNHIYYEAIGSEKINDKVTIWDCADPWFIREVFEGSEAECLLWKLTHDSSWIPYCSVEEHLDIICKG